MHLSRRTLLTAAVPPALGAALLTGAGGTSVTSSKEILSEGRVAPVRRVPGKFERHARTWMQWPARIDIWGAEGLAAVRPVLARVAQSVARFEEVIMLACPEQAAEARQLCGPAVNVHPMPVDDLWAADSGPIFVVDSREGLMVADLAFNGWGNKQAHAADAEIARRVAEKCALPHFSAGFVADGGAIEVDGEGTLITTESTLIIDNRNPGLDKTAIERRLEAALGIKKVVWIPGLRGEDITDGHPDAFVRFVRPGVVVAELPAEDDGLWFDAAREAIAILGAAQDARGRRLEIVVMRGPAKLRSDVQTDQFAASYIGYHACNGGLIMPEFGDKAADREARETLSRLHPGREVIQLDVDRICEGGGSIHCVTREQPA